MARKTKPKALAHRSRVSGTKTDDSNPLLPVLSAGADEIVGTASHAEDIFGPAETLDPMVRLWLAVIARQILDSGLLSLAELAPMGMRSGRSENISADRQERIRNEARRWLCAGLEPYATSRTTVCDLAGVDEPSLRKVCKRRLDVLHGRVIEGGNILPFDMRLARFVAAMANDAEDQAAA